MNLRYYINTIKGWTISGSEPYGKAHIARNKGGELSLCGVDVDSHNVVRWLDLCKRCEKIGTDLMDKEYPLCACPVPGFWPSQPDTCPTCGRAHRERKGKR